MRGAPWLHLSSLGVGTYLGETDARTDEQVGLYQAAIRANSYTHGTMKSSFLMDCVGMYMVP